MAQDPLSMSPLVLEKTPLPDYSQYFGLIKSAQDKAEAKAEIQRKEAAVMAETLRKEAEEKAKEAAKVKAKSQADWLQYRPSADTGIFI